MEKHRQWSAERGAKINIFVEKSEIIACVSFKSASPHPTITNRGIKNRPDRIWSRNACQWGCLGRLESVWIEFVMRKYFSFSEGKKEEFSISCKTMNCIMHLDCVVSEAVSQFLLVNQQWELSIALERRHTSTGRKIDPNRIQWARMRVSTRRTNPMQARSLTFNKLVISHRYAKLWTMWFRLCVFSSKTECAVDWTLKSKN